MSIYLKFDLSVYKMLCMQGSYGFWKVMEIDSEIFQHLESFGKEKFFKMAMEKFWIFVWENSKIS